MDDDGSLVDDGGCCLDNQWMMVLLVGSLPMMLETDLIII